MQNLVTIIIPTYNSEQYIIKTLECVKNQSYKNIEVIIVNDGSIDLTKEKISEYIVCNKLDWKLIDKMNEGVSIARNVGINNANGEYLFLLDSDDFIDKNLIEKFIYEMEKNDLDLAFCNVDIIDCNKKTLNSLKMNIEEKIYVGNDIIKGILQGIIKLTAISVMYKKSIIEKNKITFLEKCINGEDQDFYIRYLCHVNKAKLITDVKSYYVQRSGSISNKFDYRKLDAVNIIDSYYTYYKRYYDDNIDELIENKYKEELFKNINSYLKFGDSNLIEYNKILETYNEILKKGSYKFKKGNSVKFYCGYNFFRMAPNAYFKIYKLLK